MALDLNTRTALCLDYQTPDGPRRFETRDYDWHGETWNGFPAPRLPKWQAYVVELLIGEAVDQPHPRADVDETRTEEAAFVHLDGLCWREEDLGATVTHALQVIGFRATYEYPGAVFVEIPDGSYFVVGNANETWTGDFYWNADDLADGRPTPDHGFTTDVPSDEAHATVVVAAVVRAFGDYARCEGCGAPSYDGHRCAWHE